MKNSPINMSLRSHTQATDSTRNGWMANTAATNALDHNAPLIRRNSRNNSTAFAAWSRILVRW